MKPKRPNAQPLHPTLLLGVLSLLLPTASYCNRKVSTRSKIPSQVLRLLIRIFRALHQTEPDYLSSFSDPIFSN